MLIDGHGTGLVPPTEEEWEEMVSKPWMGGLSPEILKNIEFPSSFDLSSEQYWPITGDQGQLGSCLSWATAYYCYGYQEARDQGWDASSGNPAYLMNPGWVYNRVYIDGGGSGYGGNFRILKDIGCATEKSFPYQ